MGKTAAAIQLAKHFKAEILSADSRQVYRDMTIGTAVPSTDELQSVPHHFIQHRSIFEPYHVASYESEVMAFLDSYFNTHDIAILCGGTGLYINAVCNGLDVFPEIHEPAKQQVQALEQQGLEALQSTLLNLDPDYYAKVDINNPRRLCRALEVIFETGKPFSEFTSDETIKTQRPFHIIKIFLNTDRSTLYARIDRRVDLMMQAGLLQEVQNLFPHRHLKALDTVGYKELFAYLAQECSLEEAVDKIKQHSRNYAKRQITWFKKDKSYLCFEPDDIDAIIRTAEARICLET